jgi:hypothetical protein
LFPEDEDQSAQNDLCEHDSTQNRSERKQHASVFTKSSPTAEERDDEHDRTGSDQNNGDGLRLSMTTDDLMFDRDFSDEHLNAEVDENAGADLIERRTSKD